MSQKLLREFFLYISISQIFKKGFISIKGIYLNIEILGQSITFLSPFNHPQKLTFDIDYEIMNDFLELYLTLMKFVNFKLYKDIGLNYPPPEENFDLPFFGFNSLNIRQFQEKINSKEQINTKEEINIKSEEWNKISKKEEENKKLKNLFKNYIFFISREIPKEIFEMIILSCGGLYGDDTENSSFNENDERITHYIIDRPIENIIFKENKEYIQPQWIFDCVNNIKILPVSNYAPGKKLPFHLSPFYEVDDKGNYVFENDFDNNLNDDDINNDNIKKNKELSQEDIKLREMMLSNNKKKLLQKIREEALKKKKKKVVKGEKK